MAGAATLSPRKTTLDATAPAGQTILDTWFALTKAGGGEIDYGNLTAANARALYSNNWEATDIGQYQTK